MTDKEPEDAPASDPTLARMQQLQSEMQQLSRQLTFAIANVKEIEVQIAQRQGAYSELKRLQENL